MSFFLIFFLGMLTFGGILAIIGLFSPKQIHLAVEREICAEADQIFVQIADFENFVTWNPWSLKDPNMRNEFKGEKMEITHLEANERVEMELRFGPGRPAKTTFQLIKKENATQVIWTLDSNLGSNPFTRVIGRMMAKVIRKDYTLGLERLAKKLNG
ncbi:MAG: SRPBCC family protein [Cryomorphaceae bacterium]|nr:SRPBCC family protein [Cryomorphaceae bacterium]